MDKKILLGGALLGWMFASCSPTNYFDQEKYDTLVADAFPVKDIDATQTWKAVKEVTASVWLPSTSAYEVFFFTGQPQAASSRLLQHCTLEGSTIQSVAMAVPQDISSVYVAMVDGDGKVYGGSQRVNGDVFRADLSSASVSSLTPSRLREVEPMAFTFCYDEDFPSTGDYDFNDVVMAVSTDKRYGSQRNAPDTLLVDVTLRAVGTLGSIGAAMRLSGVSPEDVEKSYEVADEFAFYPYAESMVPLPDKDHQLRFVDDLDSRLRDAYVPVFDDAHYAINGGQLDETGGVLRRYYNTVMPSDMSSSQTGKETAASISPVTCRYRFVFQPSARTRLRDFNVTKVDLFAVTSYNGAFFEVHTLPYKTTGVIHTTISDNYADSYSSNYPWALLLPGDFLYPREGVAIGSLSSNIYGGAYQLPGHSFADWARDKNKANDWFRYPEKRNVYQ